MEFENYLLEKHVFWLYLTTYFEIINENLSEFAPLFFVLKGPKDQNYLKLISEFGNNKWIVKSNKNEGNFIIEGIDQLKIAISS